MITRKRAKVWRTSAADQARIAHDALNAGYRGSNGQPVFRERGGHWIDANGNSLAPAETKLFEALYFARRRAAKGALLNIGKDTGKYIDNNHVPSKTQRNRIKYALLIEECERRNVPIVSPFTRERIDAVMTVAKELKLHRTRTAVLKHLQRRKAT